VDSRGEDWANFVETGPGFRFKGRALPRASFFTLDVVRGIYLRPGRANFNDVRAGFWYAFSN
jgi:hypothetical protein